MRIFITGLGRHGKDTLAELMPSLKHVSSSYFCAEKVIYPKLQDIYTTVDECFEDRHNHRGLWYQLISAYNKEDPGRLARKIFKEYDVYVGIRNTKELERARQEEPSIVIWVDAEERLGITEDPASISITKDHADIVIYNNGTLEEFKEKAKRLEAILV